MLANARKGCVFLFLFGVLLLAACEPATPPPAAQMPSPATQTPAVSTQPAYPVAMATPAASPVPSAYPAAPTPAASVPRPPSPAFTPGPTHTPHPSPTYTPRPTSTPVILATPVITTAYIAPWDGTRPSWQPPQYLGGPNTTLWSDLFALNGRSYRWPLTDITADELARIGQTIFPKGLSMRCMQGKPSVIVPAVVNILDAARYDLDGDGQAENIYALLVLDAAPDPERFANPFPPNYWDGAMGIAILSANNDIVRWLSPMNLDRTCSSGSCSYSPHTFIAPYQIAPGVPGVLFYRWVQVDGSAGHHEDWVTVYAWQGGMARQVWHDGGSEGYRQGGGGEYYETSTIRLADVDTDGSPEILKTTDIRTSAGGGYPYVYHYRFRLYLPGSLAYRWTGQGYTACYLRPHDDTAELWPLRCGTTPFYASLISSTITLDGDWGDFAQWQYNRQLMDYTPAVNRFYWQRTYGRLNAMWDSDSLYLGLDTSERAKSLQLWFDTDLAGDFDSTVPNQDDVFIDITLPQDAAGAPQVAVMRPDADGRWQSDPAATARVQALGRLELAIPLDLLGLKEALQGVRFGAVEYDATDTFRPPLVVYRPRATRAIGFSAMLNHDIVGGTGKDPTNRPLVNGNNPTTWGTLIFMAED